MGALAVIWMVLRRMMTQWRMELCLFLGLLAATGVVTAVPLYTTGALQNTFQQHWAAADDSGTPGTYGVSIDPSAYEGKNIPAKIIEAHQNINKLVREKLQMPFLLSGWTASLNDHFEITGLDIDPSVSKQLEVFTVTDLEKYVKIVEGRMPSDHASSDGTVEIACSIGAADIYNLVIGKTYDMDSEIRVNSPKKDVDEIDRKIETVPLHFRLVGTYKLRPEKQTQLSWMTSSDVNTSLYVHPQAFLDTLIAKKKVRISSFYETWIIDRQHVRLQNVPHLIAQMKTLERDYQRFKGMVIVSASPMEVFTDFSSKQNDLRLMMLALALPTILLVLYYAVLAAGLIIEQRRGEMAMLRSRGSSTLQLVGSTVLEWLTLGFGCILLGPPIGLVIAQIFGASAGFLNFVDRKALPISMNGEAYQYAGILVLIMLVAATIPSMKAARHSIVSYKQEKSRSNSKPIWQRFYLDLLLLGVGIYGYRAMTLQSVAAAEAQSNLDRLIDPFLFIVPTLLSLAVGMVILRLLPLAAGLAEKLFARGKGVSVYTSLLEVSRNAGRYRPLILLVILTTATGIYGAAMARSLDQNTTDQVYYAIGADTVLTEQWFRMMPANSNQPSTPGSPPSMTIDTTRPYEPPFQVHKDLPGIQSVARVQFSKNTAIMKNGTAIANGVTMAINPTEFAGTAWFRPDLTPRHPFVYLNLLTKYPYGALVSEKLLEDGTLKLGDTLTLVINKQKIDVVIMAAVQYWPTLYGDKDPFVITNIDYMQEQGSIAPYDVWMKLKPGARLTDSLNTLVKKNIQVLSVKDARHELAMARRDPQKMGFYGIISVGFCVAVVVMVIGFLLYTFITLRGRFLQFGVLRAIGLSLRQLVQMLCLEQLWSVGIGLLAGTLVGQAVSAIFVPFLRTAASFNAEVPPFHIVISGGDIWTIYTVLLPVFLAALGGLALTLTRMQVHQAVKLGEEG